jgi:general secretion pathway protein K
VGGERGVALILVLWGLALMAVMAASFTAQSRTGMQLARNLVENAKAEGVADAAVNYAVFTLMQADVRRQWLADGTVTAVPIGADQARLAILDVTGLIDLNRAQDELLRGLFESAGLENEAAVRLVAAIVDFRDPDDELREDGAEDRDYEAAGLSHGAKDAPFESVDELLQVLGMTQALFEAVRPVLTVHSRRPGVNPLFAPRQAMMAISGMDEGELDSFLLTRARAGLARANPLIDPSAVVDDEKFPAFEDEDFIEEPVIDEETGEEVPAAETETDALLAALPKSNGVDQFYSLGSSRFIYLMKAEGHSREGGVFVRETVLRLTGRPDRPYTIVLWKQGDGRLPAPKAR